MKNEMKNIVLIGMMGCGKTTVGTMLSQALGRTLVDTDQLIVEREGRSINDIFAAEGEGYFRALELKVSRELGLKRGLIIACGGGLPLQSTCMEALKQGSTVFWLCRDPGETYDSMDTSERPLARQGREDFLARFAAREGIYRACADHIIRDFSSPENTMKQILEVLK